MSTENEEQKNYINDVQSDLEALDISDPFWYAISLIIFSMLLPELERGHERATGPGWNTRNFLYGRTKEPYQG